MIRSLSIFDLWPGSFRYFMKRVLGCLSLLAHFIRMRIEVNIFKGKYVVIVISQFFFSRKDNNQKFCVRFAKNVYDRMISLVCLCMPKDIFKPTHRHIALWWSMVSHCHSVSGSSFFLCDFFVIRIAHLDFSWPFFLHVYHILLV